MYLRAIFVLQLGLLTFLLGCGKTSKPEAASRPIGAPVSIQPPLGLPPLPVPGQNPPTAATIALGRRLFYDVRLSSDGSLSCASCHNPRLGFSDGKRHS